MEGNDLSRVKKQLKKYFSITEKFSNFWGRLYTYKNTYRLDLDAL